MSPVGLVSQLMVLFRLCIPCSLIVADFDFAFPVLCLEQQEMVSIEHIIAIQKREEAAQKAAAQKQQSAKRADQSRVSAPAQSEKEKGKEKGITIKEGASQAKQTTAPKAILVSKRDGKRKVGEPTDIPPATRQRTDSSGAVAMVPVTMAEVPDTRLVIHPHPLFRPHVPYKKDAPYPSTGTAILLNNPMYGLKLARSVVSVLDRQYVLKRNMSGNLSELIDLNMKVLIIVTCFLMLGFSCILNLCVSR